MTKRNRIEYLVCTLSVVVTGFIIYGLIASQQPLINESKVQSFLLFGCLGGFGFSAIVSTIILSVGFFRKRGLVFKIIASVLWPLTFGICVYVGILSYIPYQIYNIVKIIKLTRAERESTNNINL
jgi:fluoride ion exporter CrcB/FEX